MLQQCQPTRFSCVCLALRTFVCLGLFFVLLFLASAAVFSFDVATCLCTQGVCNVPCASLDNACVSK